MAKKKPGAGSASFDFLQDFLQNPMGPGLDSLFSSGGSVTGQMMSPMATPPIDVMQMLGADPTGLMSSMSGATGAGGGFMNSLAAAAPGMMLAAPAMMTLPRLIGNLMSNGTPAKFREDEAIQKLIKQGVTPNEDMGKFQREMRSDLGDDFVGNDAEGNRVNNKFFRSRDEKDLQGEDLVGRSALYDMFGSVDKDKAAKLGQSAVDSGLVNERRGKASIRMLTPKMEALAEQMGASVRSGRGNSNIGGGTSGSTRSGDVSAMAEQYGMKKGDLLKGASGVGIRGMDDSDLERYISNRMSQDDRGFDPNQIRRQNAQQRSLWNSLKDREKSGESQSSEKERLSQVVSGQGSQSNTRKPATPELKTGKLERPRGTNINNLWGGTKITQGKKFEDFGKKQEPKLSNALKKAIGIGYTANSRAS